jgi:rubrerythrin
LENHYKPLAERTMKYPVFRAGEVLDMAIQIEHQGIRFYEACASSSLRQEVLEVFRQLIEQEQVHVETFSRMKSGLDDYSLPETYSGEMRSYVDSFVQDRVFYRPAEAFENASDVKDPFKAIEFGISFEQRSILFYSAIKEVIRHSEIKVVDDVVAQEHAHIRWLLALRHKLEQGVLKQREK